MPVLLSEWHRQKAVLLTWPHAQSDWHSILPQIESSYTELVSCLTQSEEVFLLCFDSALREKLEQRFITLPPIQRQRVHYFIVPTNDTWIRDYGPLSVGDTEVCELHSFTFNAWGGKFVAELDNLANSTLKTLGTFGARALNEHTFVFEGGAVESDGAGTLLMNRDCVIDEHRNPRLNQADIEQQLTQHLGAKRFLWLENLYLEGDDTDGHIDNFARFAPGHRIIYNQCLNSNDIHYSGLKDMERQLVALNKQLPDPYELTPLPFPLPVYTPEGRRLPASYANFLITNNAVIAPVFDVATDTVAIQTLARCFPKHTVEGVNGYLFIQQGGGIHCASMQLCCE